MLQVEEKVLYDILRPMSSQPGRDRRRGNKASRTSIIIPQFWVKEGGLYFAPEPYMGITLSPLPQNNGNLPLPFLVVITHFLLNNIINDCICILTGFPGYYVS